jgi:ferrous iron transport protein B
MFSCDGRCSGCSSCPPRSSSGPAGGDDCSKRILLTGNPNVGKSAFFSRLTGVHAISSNYPGTTVGFMEGTLRTGETCYRLVDVPGAYTLEPTNEAEEIALKLIAEGGDKVIIVLDATALERNLVLALQVLERGIPSIVALNMVDEARHRGVLVDPAALQKELGVPVVPTVAVTGQGIRELVARLDEAAVSPLIDVPREERWRRIGEIVSRVQRVVHRHHTWRDRLEDASVHSLWGALIGIGVLALSYGAVRQIGEGLINLILDPFFEQAVRPVLMKVSELLGPGSFLHTLLIGTLFDGQIDFELSFGMISTGLYVEFVMVLPYIVAFYAVLSFLEDSGYLPRLAVLFDALLHRLGIHGYAVIPTLLGLGCNVPGILATRVLESKRERFIAATLISVAVPCAALQAMVVGVLGNLGLRYVLLVYGALFLSWLLLGRILHKLLPGFSPELIVEIPPYRMPSAQAFVMKLWFRIRGFLLEATPLVLGGILVANILTTTGIIGFLSGLAAPLFDVVLGLPASAAGAILLGILRKDVAVGMLIPLGLTASQLVVATVTLAMTFPCIATFVVLWKELGARDTLKSLGIMLITALAAGGFLNAAFSFFS